MAYDKTIESFADGFDITGHIDRTESTLDILTKPVSPSELTSIMLLSFLEEFQRTTSALL